MSLEATILLVTCFYFFWIAVIGMVVGSFLDCAVSRWAVGEEIFLGRSHCTSCGHALGVRDLVPLFSYLFHRGHCRFCGEKIPVDCLVAEVAGAACFLCMLLRFGLTVELSQWLIFAGLLLAVSLADWHMRIIPDGMLLALAVNRLFWLWLLGVRVEQAGPEILAAWGVPAVLLALVLAGERLAGRELMGGGDIKLLFVLALYMTWAELLLCLLAGCFLGLGYAVLGGKKRKTAVAFGPFLGAGAVLTVCFGQPVIQWYFSLF